MRNTFIKELVNLARHYPHIALIVGDLGYSVIEPFADEFPDRFVNVGIAEQNMTGLAAGMASEGYHVFTYSIANFPTFRCAEQIRNDVAYHKLPVTIVSVGGGLAYGSLGYSHHAVQDYALMRTFPNMLIAAPGDPTEVSACMQYLIENPTPSYLRLGKTGEPCFHSTRPSVVPGHWLMLRNGGENKRALLSTGAGLQFAMESIKNNDKYKSYDVYSLPLWSMESKRLQSQQLEMYEEVITIEDHLQDAGFGSWLLEAWTPTRKQGCQIRSISLNPIVCDTVGSQAMLNQIGGLFL
jgi:transketolase